MIPYGRQNISKKDIQAVAKVLASDWITQGPTVRAFEEALAKYCGVKYAVAVANGTAALHLAYLAAGIGKDDEVITTPNTFVATANMLLVVGAKPVFCDIRLDTYNIDETKIEKLINKKTKAIVPVHFSGHPCAMEAIWKIAKKHKLMVIEDAAQSLGARYQDMSIGGRSDMVMFSFHPVKTITTGEGGVIVTNNESYYERIMLLRSHGVTKDEKGFNVMTALGYNYRLTDMQAALGLSQLKRVETFLSKRHEVARWYNAALKGLKKRIALPQEVKDVSSAWHIYVIRTTNLRDRLPLYRHLLAKGVGVNFHYPAVYQHPYYQERGFTNVRCPNMELYAKTAITLPLHTLLTKKEVRYIAECIKQYFRR